MGYIDLHVHSDASDGTLSPEEVVNHALKKGLSAIALTDHDTVDGVSRAVEASKGTALSVVPGAELSCIYQEKEIHILGFFLDIQKEELRRRLKEIRQVRQKRNLYMMEQFQADGMDITLDALTAGNKDTVITRAHFARVLLEKGYVASMEQAFKKYLRYGSRYCPVREKISPEEAISLILDGGGFPALAHPIQYKLGWKGTEDLIRYLKELGLRGMEVYYSSHTQYESGRLKEIAKQFMLLPTGGSDFHGANKPDIDMGTGRGGLRISSLLLDDIEKSL